MAIKSVGIKLNKVLTRLILHAMQCLEVDDEIYEKSKKLNVSKEKFTSSYEEVASIQTQISVINIIYICNIWYSTPSLKHKIYR